MFLSCWQSSGAAQTEAEQSQENYTPPRNEGLMPPKWHLNKLGVIKTPHSNIHEGPKAIRQRNKVYKKRFCFLSQAKICFRKSKSTQGPLLSPEPSLVSSSQHLIKESKELENECSNTPGQAHFAICLLVSRGAKGLNDTPEFSLLRVETSNSQGGEKDFSCKVNWVKRNRSKSSSPVNTMPPMTLNTCTS